MKNRKCPSHKVCLDYDNGNCENCVFGETIIKLHKRIDRLKKQSETLTIQRNAWALAAKAVKEDTVRKMRDRFSSLLSEEYREYTPEGADHYFKNGAYMMRAIADRLIILIAKEMLEDNNND